MDTKEEIRKILKETGASAVGFAAAGPVDEAVTRQYSAWLESGCHAGVEYLERHGKLRENPENALEGVRTVISMAFSYRPEKFRGAELPIIASYAYGDNYHDVLKTRINSILRELKEKFGGDWRICIDTAPIPERYWALKAGIGKRGLNGSVIVEDGGSMVFLAEVLTTLEITPDTPSKSVCDGCGACVRACPTGALRGDGTVDSNKCLSHLTIEHRGDWTPGMKETLEKAKQRPLYGCDICQKVCPYTRFSKPTRIGEFAPREGIMQLDAEKILSMTEDDFSRHFKGSPIKRAKFEGLRRNAQFLAGK